jgi:hypothetical protein
MANLEKHKKNLTQELLDADESTVPASSRGTRVLGSYIKISRPVSRKYRPAVSQKVEPPPKLDVSLIREAAPSQKAPAKPSPLSSKEHLRKLEKLPQLRAPYQYKNR